MCCIIFIALLGWASNAAAESKNYESSNLTITAPKVGDAPAQEDIYGRKLGTVHFPVSCKPPAGKHAKRGLALLHHMTYEGARTEFSAAVEADSECAMGYWGQAMSFIHPLWSDPPSKLEFEKAQALVNKADANGEKTKWEQAFIAAVKAYYVPGWSRDERANLASFEQGWQEVHEQFPENLEAISFYALALMSTADPEDKSYAKQKRAADMAKQVLARIPDHPGAHHYTIHAYDYPPLAEKGLDVARSYMEIAPAVPHALHMPSHIFTRLGLWRESIAANERSADAALKHPVGDKISMHYFHALDYLAYAYLQQAQDKKAENISRKIENLEGPFQTHIATAYTLAAVPARLALERQMWTAAAQLNPRSPNTFAWDEFPAMEAITYFARALGAARKGDMRNGSQALERLMFLRDQAAKSSPYWAKQIEIQRVAALAWLEYNEGNRNAAVEMMQKAAGMEAATEKHPVTPGEILPAGELYADMLLATGRYQEAQEEYLAVLERSPNRLNSLYGVARTAELEGNTSKASTYYEKITNLTAGSELRRKRLLKAKSFPKR